ncbi:unnamed protein product [Prorocentrum cordatum]|uniref:Uncharacterized protein n=1 Tax=Prorocentrum cordatum TaxID=2364126 RepID=A0ABN9VT04_9DINO|nr:unnamed protein product [Polarella glacialis]
MKTGRTFWQYSCGRPADARVKGQASDEKQRAVRPSIPTPHPLCLLLHIARSRLSQTEGLPDSTTRLTGHAKDTQRIQRMPPQKSCRVGQRAERLGLATGLGRHELCPAARRNLRVDLVQPCNLAAEAGQL